MVKAALVPAMAMVVALAGCSTQMGQAGGATSGSADGDSDGAGGGGGAPADARPIPEGLRPGSLTIVVGAHAGAPAPDMGKVGVSLVEASVSAGDTIRIVGDDGSPTVLPVNVPALDTSSDLSRQVSSAKAVNAVRAAVLAVLPDSDHADPLESILVATSTLTPPTSTSGSTRGTVLVCDNLLSDQGLINTSRPGVLTAVPEAVAADVKKKYGGVSLSGVTVVLSGYGATVRPQAPLATTQSAHLADIYATALESLGATVYLDPIPRNRLTKISTTHAVTVTTVPKVDSFVPPVPGTSTTVVLTEKQVRFQSNSNAYDGGDRAARTALQPLALWLNGDRSRRSVSITGTTSSAGDAAGRRQRSTGRAETVRATLIQLGAAPTQITKVQGVGSQFKGFVRDRDANGALIEEQASRNRLVIIVATQAMTP